VSRCRAGGCGGRIGGTSALGAHIAAAGNAAHARGPALRRCAPSGTGRDRARRVALLGRAAAGDEAGLAAGGLGCALHDRTLALLRQRPGLHRRLRLVRNARDVLPVTLRRRATHPLTGTRLISRCTGRGDRSRVGAGREAALLPKSEKCGGEENTAQAHDQDLPARSYHRRALTGWSLRARLRVRAR